MSRSWVANEYGDVMTLEDACKVLRVTRQRLSSWIRFGKVRATKVGDERFIAAREVQHILDNPKRRIQTYGKSDPEEIEELARDGASMALASEDIQELAKALRPWVQKVVAEEVDKQARVVIRREGPRTQTGVSQNQVSTKVDTPSKPAETVAALDETPWIRENRGTEEFPLYL